jgi:hypothetical protein
MPEYHALTVWQPWATLIAIGAKPFEFRRWAAPRAYWNKRIAIHAGARPVKPAEIVDLLYRLQQGNLETGLDPDKAIPLLEQVRQAPKMLPLSHVLATAVLGKPLNPEEARARFAPDSDRGEHHNHAWPLTDIRPLEPPQPASGLQGFWLWRTAS